MFSKRLLWVGVVGLSVAPLAGFASAAAERDAGASRSVNWPGHGGTSDETAYSPLGEIDRANVRRLGLAWFLDLPAGAPAPDLRESRVAVDRESLWSVVHDGAMLERGMPRFDNLDAAQVRQIQGYILARAREALGKMAHSQGGGSSH